MIKIPQLKCPENMFHHYIIGVGMHGIRCSKKELRGTYYLKYGPYYFTLDDLKNMQKAVIMGNDPWIKTPQHEANKICGCSQLVNTIAAMNVAAHANNCTLHHIYSEFKVEEEWFLTFVESCSVSEESVKKLEESRIS
jgi:hypothetical protein